MIGTRRGKLEGGAPATPGVRVGSVRIDANTGGLGDFPGMARPPGVAGAPPSSMAAESWDELEKQSFSNNCVPNREIGNEGGERGELGRKKDEKRGGNAY